MTRVNTEQTYLYKHLVVEQGEIEWKVHSNKKYSMLIVVDCNQIFDVVISFVSFNL